MYRDRDCKPQRNMTADTQKPVGYFWRGADNKVYVQGPDGINAAGNWDANTANYWQGRGFAQTADSQKSVNLSQFLRHASVNDNVLHF